MVSFQKVCEFVNDNIGRALLRHFKEIVVKCKHKLREKKAYYLTKSDLKYITDWYVFVQPDGKIEPGEGAYEYVYPFICRLNEKGEIVSLWENYN